MVKITPSYAKMKSPLPHPGEILTEEFLKPMGITQAAFAKHVGLAPCVISGLAQGKRGITVQLAIKFSQALGPDPDFWLNLQTQHDLSKAFCEMRRKPSHQPIERLEPVGME